MLLTIDIESKTIGNKRLFNALRFAIEPHQKIAVIGRNGVGKTTLFAMLTGQDTDFTGTIAAKRGTRIVSTAQEHHGVENLPVVDYVLQNLPEFSHLKHIIDTYPATMSSDLRKIQTYSNALERFNHLGYYQVEEAITRSLAQYQITNTMARGRMAQLSGGQKRFVELVRIEHADADIALVDEPTNHMDSMAKADFVAWLKATRHAVMVITHDRDVLQCVDAIVEIKDGAAHVFKGNYDAYLAQNTTATTTRLHDYQVALHTLDNLHKKIMWARARKPSWHGTADQRNPFEVMERRLQKEYDDVKQANPRPTFWIDRESADGLTKKVGDNYEKFKAKNIRIHHTAVEQERRELIWAEDLVLGYDTKPLFAPLNFRLQSGERLRLVGRNGAGKTTLVRAMVSASQHTRAATQLLGTLTCSPKLRLSMYEQETRPELLTFTLAHAVERIYEDAGLPVSVEATKQVLSDYLFDPSHDGNLLVEQLSGGQKARLQLIRLFASKPNLLILDEPTNHLDLPSIEELENALANYHGAVLYITHDSYFAKNIGGEHIDLRAAPH